MNDVKVSECKFSFDIVPYMYGEMSRSETSAFESHLPECTICTDEFASISNARYEVYDWKKLEFDPLATPQIKIALETESRVSWMEKVRAVFAQSWAIPSAAAAGVIVVAILAAAFILSQKGPADVAANLSKDVVAEEPTVPSAPQAADEGSIGNARSEDHDSKSRTVRAGAPQRVSQRRTVGAAARSRDIKATSAQNEKKAPRLNEFVEEEDTSVRLAELFDDIETSE